MQCSPSKLHPEVQRTLGLPVGWPEDAAERRQWPLLLCCHQRQEAPPHDHLQQEHLCMTSSRASGDDSVSEACAEMRRSLHKHLAQWAACVELLTDQ